VRHRIIVDIGVSIVRLGIVSLWYNGICTDEAAYLAIVPPRVHVNQLNVTVFTFYPM